MSFQDRKKILTSRAYHLARDEAIRNGLDDAEAKKLARDASQKVAARMLAEIDANAPAHDDEKQQGE